MALFHFIFFLSVKWKYFAERLMEEVRHVRHVIICRKTLVIALVQLQYNPHKGSTYGTPFIDLFFV